jgi:hypothetical protein
MTFQHSSRVYRPDREVWPTPQYFGSAFVVWQEPRRINWYRIGALIFNLAAWALFTAIVIVGLAVARG